MKTLGVIVAAAAASPAPAAAPAWSALPAGVYTNQEEVYFDREANRTQAPWMAVEIDGAKSLRFVDPYGKPTEPIVFTAIAANATTNRLTIALPGGRNTELRLSRPFTCWGAALKTAKTPEGKEDWFGATKLKLHDQGGRVRFGGGDTGAPETILRMRNVVWPSGPNRPSIVLYVHTPDAPERAVGYSWADKDAKTVGINLRWMQASCTLDSTQ